jgi:hypothetical protein
MSGRRRVYAPRDCECCGNAPCNHCGELKKWHGYAEYLLYVDAQTVGQIGATTRDALSGIASPHTLRQTTAWPGGYANIYRDAFEAGYRRSSPNGRIRR